jgi:tetratricopeptide (TPR) repeat protein
LAGDFLDLGVGTRPCCSLKPRSSPTSPRRQLCKDFPRSGELHNQLAWLSARCRRELDAGLDHAGQAAKLAPKNAGYLDTLAELHFQRGDQKRALEIIAQAIALDPHLEYLRQQRQRMMAGDRNAPLPEE